MTIENWVKEAINFYFEALKIRPDDSETYYWIGVLMGDKWMYTKAIWVLTKALEVFKIGDNSHILFALARYSMMIGRIMDTLTYINYLVERKRNDVELLMIKSYILSLNNWTLNESKMIFIRCQQFKEVNYDDIPLIKEFKATFKSPIIKWDENTGHLIDETKKFSDFKQSIEISYDVKTLKNLIFKDLAAIIDK